MARNDAWKRLGTTLPGGDDLASDLLWQELDAYFSWFSRAATQARVLYQALKLISLLLAALVTVLAARSAPAALTASFGAGIVVVEGIQQLFKFHTNWLRYRVATETLRMHALLYVARLAPYDGEPEASRTALGNLLSSVLEDERRQWSVQMKPPEPDKP